MQPYSPHFLCNQAEYTRSTRHFFYHQAHWDAAPVALDIGCGSGTITPELADQAPHATGIGFDIDPSLLKNAIHKHRSHPTLHFLLADATFLPFRSSCATFALSHFTMMWISNRKQALTEVHRVLRSNGVFTAIEPDYAGRIETPRQPRKQARPSSLPIITYLQKTGADPYTGSRLSLEIKQSQFENIRFGVLAWQHNPSATHSEIREEAQILQSHNIPWTPPEFTFTPIFWLLAIKP